MVRILASVFSASALLVGCSSTHTGGSFAVPEPPKVTYKELIVIPPPPPMPEPVLVTSPLVVTNAVPQTAPCQPWPSWCLNCNPPITPDMGTNLVAHSFDYYSGTNLTFQFVRMQWMPEAGAVYHIQFCTNTIPPIQWYQWANRPGSTNLSEYVQCDVPVFCGMSLFFRVTK